MIQPFEGEGKKKERGKEGESFRERESTFSLDFSAINLSNPGEARGKVDPHCKSYARFFDIVEFRQLRVVRVFSYSVISCLKCHENGFGSCEAENDCVFRSQRNETECLMRGLSLDSPQHDSGLFKKVRN